MKTLEEQLIKFKLNPPYDCPNYFNNWNCDDSCKEFDGDCEFDEFTGCPTYNDIFGIHVGDDD